MSVLYITEFTGLGRDGNGVWTDFAAQLPLAEQEITLSGTTAQSSALNASTSLVRLHTDVICSVIFGTNPTATTAKMRMAAGQTEYFTVPPGQGVKVAGIVNT